MFRPRARILIPILAMFFSASVFGGGIWWVRRLSSERLSRILENQQVLVASAQELSELDILRRQHASVAPTRPVLVRAIPQRGDLITLPARLAALGEGIGVSASASFGTEEIGSGGKPSSIEVLIFASGNLPSLLRFIEELERAKSPVIDTRGFDLHKAAQGGRLQGTLQTRVYFRL